MSILIFLLVLFFLILVHELGHFLVAKWAGMRVDEFGIGFPPKLFGIKRGETEYTLNALPFGGFVKIQGENNEEHSHLDKRSFNQKSKWAQAAVLVAGVLMNALFAWALFSLAFVIGTQNAVSEADAGPDAELMVVGVLPDFPAEQGGLTKGAVIVGIEGTETLTPSSFKETLKQNGSVTVSYMHSGERITTVLTPELYEASGEEVVGASLSLVETIQKPLHVAVSDGFMLMLTGLRDITIGIGALLVDAFSLNADLSNIAGPVGIVGLVGDASALGFSTLLMFTAFISLNLAVINLLPFPALDGGRLLFVGIEALKGSPIPPRVAGALNGIGFLLLILLLIAVTFSDIARIL